MPAARRFGAAGEATARKDRRLQERARSEPPVGQAAGGDDFYGDAKQVPGGRTADGHPPRKRTGS